MGKVDRTNRMRKIYKIVENSILQPSYYSFHKFLDDMQGKDVDYFLFSSSELNILFIQTKKVICFLAKIKFVIKELKIDGVKYL